MVGYIKIIYIFVKEINVNINVNIKTMSNLTISKWGLKTPDYNGIQQMINDNFLDLQTGIKDVYEFCSEVANKFFITIDPLYGERTDENPLLDLLFSILTVNGIELY